MKPLPVASFTAEDWAIVQRAFERGPASRWLSHSSQLADRRDARLMLAWAQGWPIDLGGDDENGECLFWRKWPTFGFEQA